MGFYVCTVFVFVATYQDEKNRSQPFCRASSKANYAFGGACCFAPAPVLTRTAHKYSSQFSAVGAVAAQLLPGIGGSDSCLFDHGTNINQVDASSRMKRARRTGARSTHANVRF